MSRDRSLVRKFQEAFLTWYIEKTMSKDQILEAYLNIIEFGPDLYGIAAAARHHLNKPPAQLRVLEATYLASTLPSPVRRFVNSCNGQLTRGYEDLLRGRLQRMRGLNMLSEEAYSAAINQNLVFDASHLDSRQSCR